ncbi:MAG: hypothetical protein M3Z23_13495 [Acidobacteriota bacterium]|nr:hypothetical protein [Acidobacteriota bacterium]
MDRVEDRLEKLLGIVEGLTTVFEDSQRKTEERFAQNEKRFEKIAEVQAQNDEALGVLVKMMDEWIRNGRH